MDASLLSTLALRGAASLILTSLLLACSGEGDTADSVDLSDTTIEDASEDTGPDAEPDLGSGPDVVAGPPNIDISPIAIAFEDVRLDDEASAIVTIRNTGESPLIVTRLTIEHFQLPGTTPQFRPGDGWTDSFELAPNTYRDVTIRWVPTLYTGIGGRLIIGSDDPDTPEVIIPIQSTSAYAQAEAPRYVNFGSVSVGETATREITVYNRGFDPLNITALTSTGNEEFASQFSARALEPQLPAFLQRNDKIDLELSFSPTTEELSSGQLTIASNLPDGPDIIVELQGNGPAPCIRTSGDLDFGELLPGAETSDDLIVLNCSRDRSLTIHTLELTNDGGGVFSLPALPTLPLVLGIAQTEAIAVDANLNVEQEALGQLTLTTNDPTQGEIVLQLRARPLDDSIE
ncbi:choice-of-anchor D domain-containing protein [Bradymonadaceae bacterium TMQ3]|nr:choice-of-anchor D domain-containing protein [Bradymonadaceae bacterium TMQ3]TXC75504.1 choice-of-anchor D domain-containing protein [Bradymonadales bacterium TMQ1]